MAAGDDKPNSNNNNSGKPKKRKYLPHSKPVRKGSYPLRPGVQGFFITCDGGRERQATNEALSLLDAFYEELVDGKDSGTTREAVASKPLNKIIKFKDSDSSEDEDESSSRGEDSVADKTKEQNEDPDAIKQEENEDPKAVENEEEGEDKPAKKQCIETVAKDEKADSENAKDKPIDELIEDELKEMGNRNKRHFVSLDSGCNGCIFIQMQRCSGDPGPARIVQHIMTSAASTRKHMSRFILRVVPVEVTCYSSEEEISKAIAPLIEQHFPTEAPTPQKVNDTVGTLALSHYHDEDTVAAVIIGTGTNACYVERTDAIIKCQGLLTNSGKMVVNMEWGNFWSSHLPRTPYDVSLDDESQNRNDQGFEKMISGMYIGEIVRRVLYRMAQESDIFGDASATNLSVPFALSTPLMAAMHEDDSPDLREVGRVLKENMQMPDISLKARRLIVRVCDIVTRRAARLAAAGIVGILKKIGRDGSGGVGSGRTKGEVRRTVVAIEGGLYVSYSTFREYLNEAVVEILGEEVAQSVILRVFEDGSGIGAALLAASHSSER